MPAPWLPNANVKDREVAPRWRVGLRVGLALRLALALRTRQSLSATFLRLARVRYRCLTESTDRLVPSLTVMSW